MQGDHREDCRQCCSTTLVASWNESLKQDTGVTFVREVLLQTVILKKVYIPLASINKTRNMALHMGGTADRSLFSLNGHQRAASFFRHGPGCNLSLRLVSPLYKNTHLWDCSSHQRHSVHFVLFRGLPGHT